MIYLNEIRREASLLLICGMMNPHCNEMATVDLAETLSKENTFDAMPMCNGILFSGNLSSAFTQFDLSVPRGR